MALCFNFALWKFSVNNKFPLLKIYHIRSRGVFVWVSSATHGFTEPKKTSGLHKKFAFQRHNHAKWVLMHNTCDLTYIPNFIHIKIVFFCIYLILLVWLCHWTENWLCFVCTILSALHTVNVFQLRKIKWTKCLWSSKNVCLLIYCFLLCSQIVSLSIFAKPSKHFMQNV